MRRKKTVVVGLGIRVFFPLLLYLKYLGSSFEYMGSVKPITGPRIYPGSKYPH